MAKRNRLSASATAKLLVLNAKRYSEEKKKDISRYAFTAHTLRRFAGRLKLHSSFVSELDIETCELGWVFIQVSDTDYAIINLKSVEAWPKLSAKRVSDLINDSNAEQMIQDSYESEISEEDGEVIED